MLYFLLNRSLNKTTLDWKTGHSWWPCAIWDLKCLSTALGLSKSTRLPSETGDLTRLHLTFLCFLSVKIRITYGGLFILPCSTDSYIEVLDGSRVHPETYEWARKMAVDALEYDESAEDANPAGALEEILENPERLKDLDLDAFAEELERQVRQQQNIQLIPCSTCLVTFAWICRINAFI